MKIRFLFVLGLFFLMIGGSFASCESVSLDLSTPASWKNPEIVKLLQNGKVISMQPMREYLQSLGKKAEFDGDVYLVELDNGFKAVFKPLSPDDIGDAHAEVAAYKASVILGFPYVPPTVMAQLQGKKGSLQLFVETKIDSLSPEAYETALREVHPDDLANLKLFYFVFGQWDSGRHNLLILNDKEKTSLIAIDNSGIRNHQHVKYGQLPFVRVLYSDKINSNDWDKPFPFDQAQSIKKPTAEKIRQVLGDILPESFYKSFKSYGPPFRYVLYRNSLWRQFHAGNDSFVLSFSDHLPDQTRKKLEGLNLATLKKIFAEAKNADFLTSAYLAAILERRDQVLQYFTQR